MSDAEDDIERVSGHEGQESGLTNGGDHSPIREDEQNGNNDEEDQEDGESIQQGDDVDDDEEDEEDEDEEEARRVAEGFIVDDEEEEEEADSDADQVVTKKRRKRVADEDEDEGLDEEDLALLEENTGQKLTRTEPKLKRLKRGRQEEEAAARRTGTLEDIFSDDEARPDGQREAAGEDEGDEEMDYRDVPRDRFGRGEYDEMDDFIADEDEDDLDEIVRDRERYEKQRVEARDLAERRERVRDILPNLPAGLDQEALDDVLEIFGDGYEYEWALYSTDQQPNGDGDFEEEKKEPQLKDFFEPSELAERMYTDADEQIRIRDIPERMQLRYAGLKSDTIAPLNDNEVAEEGAWIARTLALSQGKKEPPSEKLISAVSHVVKFLSQEFMEVPFIAAHRRDYFTETDRMTGEVYEILNTDDLWNIYDLDFRFRSFLDRRTVFRAFYEKLGIHDQHVEDLLEMADSVEDITDLTDYLQAMHAEEVNEAKKKSTAYRRPASKSFLELCRGRKVEQFAKEMGIAPKELGANLLYESKRHFADDPSIAPEIHAEAFIDPGFENPSKVIRAAKQILAQQIALDPQVRKALRREWETRAVVDVHPTKQGFLAIDDLHKYHPFKYLKNKPLSAFDDAQFLELLRAEQEDLLEISIRIGDSETWFRENVKYYLSDGVSDIAKVWNELRSQIFRMALNDYVTPIMQKWIREKLRTDAEDRVCREAKESLEAKVNVQCFRSLSMDAESLPRVLAMSFGNGDPAKDVVQMAFLNHQGRFVDQLTVTDVREDEPRAQVKEIIRYRRPDVIAVSGFTINTRRLIENIKSLLGEMDVDDADDENSPKRIPVVVINDEVARLFQHSQRGIAEFPDVSELVRYCICLARTLQNPTLEYASMGRDLLSLRHHEKQFLVSEDKLMSWLERALINVVNEMGVDVNEAVRAPHYASILQYVSGLGTRKAQNMLKKIEAGDRELESRADLVTRKITTRVIWMNCASFIRIRPAGDRLPDDVLDDTRIHPQDYELARKMAADALEIDEDDMDDMKSKKKAVYDLMTSATDKLNDLILEDYADMLEKLTNQPKRQTLEQIKEELQNPYAQKRKPFEPLSPADVFKQLTGETEQTLRPGLIVPILITKCRGRWANCRLDSGLDGLISVDQASDDRVHSVEQVFRVGSTVDAKVLSINLDRYQVDLATRSSILRGGDLELRKIPTDPYFDQDREAVEHQANKKRLKEAAKSNRSIKHPLFHNFDHRQAEEYLADRQRGDLVIRPSSKGRNHIAVTWKVDDGLFQHIDILEENKANDFSIGSVLRIGELTYHDLDELIVSHVEALVHKVEELMASPKFVKGGLDRLTKHLDHTIQATPNRSLYGLCLDNRPGFFDLAFKINVKVPAKHWLVKVLPGGYRLEGTLFPDVTALTNGFKTMIASKNRMQQRRHAY